MTDTATPTGDGGYVMGEGYEPYVEPVEQESAKTALQKIPRPVRLTIYALYALGGPVLIYLQAKGAVGADELALWAGVGTVLGITAAGNVSAG